MVFNCIDDTAVGTYPAFSAAQWAAQASSKLPRLIWI